MDKNNLKYNEIAAWWERKRKTYNLILIGFSIFVIIWDYRYYSTFGTLTDYDLGGNIGRAIFLIIPSNIGYCLGGGFDAACKYYEQNLLNVYRHSLYWIGVTISILYVSMVLSPWT